MGCQHYSPTDNGADSFTVAMPRLTVGRGTLAEVGVRAVRLGMKRVALFTDPNLASGPLVSIVKAALNNAELDVAIFSDIRVEPDDDSVERGTNFLRGSKFDGMVSVGGGSVIDTAKACLVLLNHGGNILDYFAPPIGNGASIPGPLLPHIACPTTSGTGSECTSISVLRVNKLNTKFVIASPYMLPDAAIVDPQCCDSLPSNVVASTGFDLCCHALECYTAKAYTKHNRIESPDARQYIQGANPFSEMVAREALAIVGNYLERGVNDASDQQARDQLMWGATLAGIAFGNSGTHLPHAMSYGVTHLMHDIETDGYPVASPFIPHGISVIVTAPSIFKYTAEATPERHLQGAEFLLADTKGATPDDAGEVLANRLIELMKATKMPNGLTAIGFGEQHVSALATSSVRQEKAIANAPRESNQVDLENMYRSALSHW
ncbi:MAG: hydroxyacid-oxoacid transhydrogenase [Granulosicoccus sp.]|jgi:hydroxyacid-oxoacid transhydrogenase